MKYYSQKELARAIGRTRQRVDQLIKDGKIKTIMVGPYHKIPVKEFKRVVDIYSQGLVFSTREHPKS